jgi:uncharacterized protein (TIGR00255 family)
MTGYGRALGEFADKQITVEVRSVNNRSLDCTVKLPRLYAFAEDAIKQCVKQHVSRGKVDVFVTVNQTRDSSVRIALNRSVLEGYLAAMSQMVSDYGVRDDVSVTALSRLPDVFTVEKAEEDEDQLKTQLLAVAGQALDAYDAMRSDRIYRKGLPLETIRAEMIRARGTQFDPELLDAFLLLMDTEILNEIAEQDIFKLSNLETA